MKESLGSIPSVRANEIFVFPNAGFDKLISDMINKQKMYKYHQENVLAIQQGMKYTLENIKSGIIKTHLSNNISESKKHKRYILIQTRILSGLVVSWSETIIKRLYYESNSFSDLQIEKLHELNLQQKWEFALRVGFCKSYNCSYSNASPLFNHINIESQTSIPRSARDKYKHIVNLIVDELLPAINIRNKVQHGEWIKAFTTPNSLEFSGELTRDINKEDIISLQTKVNQFKAIYQLVHDLVVHKQGNETITFERDFDKNYQRIENNRKLASIRTQRKYKEDIIARYERGLNWKINNNRANNGIFTRFLNRMIN